MARRSFLLLLLGLLWPGLPVTAQSDEPPALFDPPAVDVVQGAATAAAPAKLHANSVRTRSLAINAKVLAGLVPGQPNRVSLPLFADRSYTAILSQDGRPVRGFAVWRGSLDGLDNSSVSIVHRDGVVVMQIFDGKTGTFYVKPLPGGGHFVEEAGHGLQGTCGTPDAAPVKIQAKPKAKAPAQSPAPAPMLGSTTRNSLSTAQGSSSISGDTWVDVLLLYTPNARIQAGGVTAIEAVGVNFVTHANYVHARSDTHVRLRLVGIEEIAYDDSAQDLALHLSRLANPTDGFMDSAFTRQNELGADVVCLLPYGRANSGSTLGIAHLPGTFSVVESTQDPNAFVHEIGHNLGCRHESANDSGGTYEHGYSHTETWLFGAHFEKRITIMYSGFNTDTRTDYFSNPNITFLFTGNDICGGLCENVYRPLGVADQADNARYLRENRLNTSVHRQPFFYLSTTGSTGNAVGDATLYRPDNSLLDILNVWFANTETDPSLPATIRIAPGTYTPPIRITAKSRLEKVGTGSNVRIGQ